jgi:hypothetical protein
VSKPKDVKKSLIISPIMHHSQTVEDCLRKKKKNWKLKEEKKMSTIVLILFLPQPCDQLATLERKNNNSGYSVI